MTVPATSAELGDLALHLLARDPQALGGCVIRMRAGPQRDAWLQHAENFLGSMTRLHPSMDDGQLFGSIDIAATLAKQKVVKSTGVLSPSKAKYLVMAERCSPHLAARLAQYLDGPDAGPMVLLDEAAGPNEGAPENMKDRLAFCLEEGGRAMVPPRSVHATKSSHDPSLVNHSDADLRDLCAAAYAFGIESLRAPFFALRAAKGLAALDHRTSLSQDDLATAAALVFSHRATRLPSEENESDIPEHPEQNSHQENDDVAGPDSDSPLDRDLLIEAVKTWLPPEVLAGLGAGQKLRTSSGTGAGAKRTGNRRGRPLPSRPGRLDGRKRLDVVATLRAAAPWQTIRRRTRPDYNGILLSPSDFRVKRFEMRSDRAIVVAVDASGSAAMARLNEAKGAVELLLANAYASRDHVSLVSFRGSTADCLLAPTRSLVQAKRKLSSMPGGGGTPLAAGIAEAMNQALQARARGMTPTVVLLTDGRGNVGLDGQPGRQCASEDARKMARAVLMSGLDAMIVDMSRRPHAELRDLAQIMDAQYLPMPRADSEHLAGRVQDAISGG